MTESKSKSRPRRAADLLVQTLLSAGVQKIFTLSGNQIMPVFDACVGTSIELIHVRHEAAAVHMADAWGRLTGQAGVALLTAGPGHANAIGALYTALGAESPLVMLSGHAPMSQYGGGAFQEMPQAELAAHVCKAARVVTDAQQIANELQWALDLAQSGRPGPVHLSLPFDVLQTELATLTTLRSEPSWSAPGAVSTSLIQDILQRIKQAERPLIVTGPALIYGENEQLPHLSEALGVPVITLESPRGINDPGLGQLASVLQQTDLLLLMGKALDFTLQFGRPLAENCAIVQIDTDEQVLAITRQHVSVERIVLQALVDVDASIRTLLQQLGEYEPAHAAWLQQAQHYLDFRPSQWHDLPANHAAAVSRAVQAWLEQQQDVVFIADGGEFGQWAQACISITPRLINSISGSIGSALPMAIAAQSTKPERTVVALMGDGTFGFHMAEFDTAVRYGLPVIVVIGNDACWNAEYQIQLRQYGQERTLGCELLPTRYDQVVSAMGGYGDFITSAAGLPDALQRAKDSGLPACINVAIQRQPAPQLNH